MALFRETLGLGTRRSLFFDSPLNSTGIQQAEELRKFLEKAEVSDEQVLNALRGVPGHSSVLVSSPLSRAAATVTIALWPRLQEGGEKVVVLPALQEISRNIDTLSLAAEGRAADMPELEVLYGKAYDAGATFDASAYKRNKPIFGTGLTRLNAFAAWAMQRPEEVVVVSGHSLWFKFFFDTYLPLSSDHVARTSKVYILPPCSLASLFPYSLHTQTRTPKHTHASTHTRSTTPVWWPSHSKWAVV
jgi:broad specificity phosphatase PhoE